MPCDESWINCYDPETKSGNLFNDTRITHKDDILIFFLWNLLYFKIISVGINYIDYFADNKLYYLFYFYVCLSPETFRYFRFNFFRHRGRSG